MKSRFTVVSILALLGILVFSASASALTWETYLEDITVPSGTVDIDITYWYNGTTNASGASAENITLPCNLENLSQTETNFTIYNTGTVITNNASFNLTINGVAINTTQVCNPTNENVTFLSDIVGAGVSNTDEYLNFSFDCNQTTTIIGINITAADANFSTTWLSSYIAVAESVLTAPKIDDHQAYSYFSVKDRVVVTNSLNYTITDISLLLIYATQNLTIPSTHVNITTMATSTISYNNISYQKYGPYVSGTIKEEIDDDDHAITIRVSSHEVLTRLVDWDFDETGDDYEDYFATLDFDTLIVKLNGVVIDWDEGTIEMDDMTLVDGTNKYLFSWTEAEAVAPTPAPGAWDWLSEDYGTGIALWLWIIIMITIVCIIVAVIFAIRKK